MNTKDGKNTGKTIFGKGDIVRVFSSFSLSPAKAMGKQNAELSFGSIALPVLTYVFFALQLVLDRLSFILTLTGIQALLNVFIALIVGAVMSLVSAGLLYSVLNLRSVKTDFQCLLLCSNFAFIIPFLIEFIGFFIRLIFNTPTTMTFGLTGLLFALIPYGRLTRALLEKDVLWYVFTVAANGILMVFASNIIFFSLN